ncbi:PilX N-terminal domain-containing pilus assembly protein [Dyella sp. C9]|uniref:pilus assembly PilX family protein n=1 Tax=Dyella sp. C9 TaxID=2202154 RepID=UPI000DEF4C5B|nr:PilX N-terminal domain-containing pilus assembly protein [Dyella sp. C9]
MRRSIPSATSRVQRGVALFVGLVFLTVLSVVALVAMRGTLMEMHMVNNVAAHERAFEVSESLRAVPVALFDEHTFNRGWPLAAMGGTVPDTNFGTFPRCGSKPVGSNGVSCNVLTATAIRSSDDTGLVNFYDIAFRAEEKPYDPSTWMGNAPDVTITVCNSGACTSGGSARIWIRPDGTALSDGSGAAQAAGYRGEGNAAASGGGAMYFQILSEGTANASRAVTLSQYRQRISN